ncbi:hypothetical protein JCM6294_661 [Bacteroides pyogenes DSM 20611 = JCM 6294]|uniref:Uncharacterized protein n=1 Tax=Bacteroides pyogenes DSM 20611 = JCM 6294 TaxID=1121100 RepID=W4PFA2_9BACE|nr:hypothetical protein JCM6294_661 [Bacteroides pyogenes DSM 20611 = JCM 6294]
MRFCTKPYFRSMIFYQNRIQNEPFYSTYIPTMVAIYTHRGSHIYIPRRIYMLIVPPIERALYAGLLRFKNP